MLASRLSVSVIMSRSVSSPTPEELERRAAIRAEVLAIHRKQKKDWSEDDRKFIKAVFLDAHKNNGGNVSASSRAAGIDSKTYYNWCNPTYVHYDEEFANESREVAEECDDNVESALYRNALEGNHSSQAFWLTNRRPAKWKSMQHHNSTAEVKVTNLSEGMSFDQAIQIVKAAGIGVPEQDPGLAADGEEEE